MTHTYIQLHLTQMHTHTPTHAPALPNPLILPYFSHSTGFFTVIYLHIFYLPLPGNISSMKARTLLPIAATLVHKAATGT